MGRHKATCDPFRGPLELPFRTTPCTECPRARETVHVSVDPTSIVIPADLLPQDGRFGCGPSKVRAEQVLALAQANQNLLGTARPP